MTSMLTHTNEWVIEQFRAELASLPEIAEPVRGRRERLAPGIWVVRIRQWLPVSVLDRLSELPPTMTELVQHELPILEWQEAAACRGAGLAKFFGLDDAPRQPSLPMRVLKEARAVCGVCEVVRTCFVWSLTRQETHGIWAGMSGRQRKPLLRQLKTLPPAERAAAIETIADQWLSS